MSSHGGDGGDYEYEFDDEVRSQWSVTYKY